LNGVPKLDRIDLNILVQLQKDGRMTNANLAEAVNLSVACNMHPIAPAPITPIRIVVTFHHSRCNISINRRRRACLFPGPAPFMRAPDDTLATLKPTGGWIPVGTS
jgi:AsnC-type helix-turn-helix domain